MAFKPHELITSGNDGTGNQPGLPGYFLAAGLIAICATGAVYLERPPAPEPVNAPAAEFSSGRALERLQQFARAPRPIGSAEHAAARSYIVKALAAGGAEPQVQTAAVVIASAGPPYRAATIHNVIGRRLGTNNSGAILLMAHYDSVATAPGASDDGSGVVTLIETARALKAGPALRNDVIFLFTDGEEAGLFGARAFVREHPWAKDVKLALNFEARGNGGPSYMFETSNNNQWLIEGLSRAAAYPFASSLSYEIYKRLPNDTDLTIFKNSGIAGMNFAYIRGIDRYHTAKDNLDTIDERSVQHDGSYALSLSRYFGNANFPIVSTGNAIYFNPLGAFMVHYPASLAWPLTLLVWLSLGTVIWVGLQRGVLNTRGIVLGMAALPISAIIAWTCVAVLWGAVTYLHGGYRQAPGGEPYNSGLYAMSFVSLTLAVTLAIYNWFQTKTSNANLALGGLMWWALLGVAVSALMPGGSYLFTWPVLCLLFGLAMSHTLRRKWSLAEWLMPLLCSIPAILLVSPLIQQLFTALTLNGAALICVLVVLGLGLLIPNVPLAPRRGRWFLPGLALLITTACFIAGFASSEFNPNHPKQNSISYGLNSDTGKAAWFSMDARPDQWTARFLTSSPVRGALPDYFPTTNLRFLSAPAPATLSPAPVIELLDDSVAEGVRTFRLRIASPRKAPFVAVYVDKRVPVVSAQIEGKTLNPVQDQRSWSLSYYGVPDEGISLALKIQSPAAITMHVCDRSYGFEDIPKFQFEPRPPDMMPVASGYSEMTFVCKTRTFK